MIKLRSPISTPLDAAVAVLIATIAELVIVLVGRVIVSLQVLMSALLDQETFGVRGEF